MTQPLLDPAAEAAIRQRVADLERSTGVEVVAAVVARADSYPEIPWKAFALGASLAALAAVAAALRAPGWEAAGAVMEAAVAVLATGGAAALATVWIAPFARWLLPRARRQAEVLQYAQALFLDSGLHRTRRRDGILLLVSLFEREVVVLPDEGVRGKLGPGALQAAVSAVTARVAQGALQDAVLDGLGRIEDALAAAGCRPQPADVNELADSVIQRRGPA